MTALSWTFARLADLSPLDVHALLQLRAAVFSVEQNCVFQDPDDADVTSWHLLGRNADGALLAYLRIVDAGIKYREPSIGRVVTAPAARGLKLGRALMTEGIARCTTLWPAAAIVIGAQHRLERFYRDFGFEPSSEPYLEDGIWHIEMTRPAEHVSRRQKNA
jgi:ElaA protein